jgi:hypothetical protein
LRNRCGLGLNQNPPFLGAHLLIDVDLKINRDLKGLQGVAVQMLRLKAEGYKGILQGTNHAIQDLFGFYDLWFSHR